MRSPARSLLAALTLVVSAACVDEPSDTGEEGGAPPGPAATFESLDERPCPEESFVGYEDFGGPFIITWCNGCHASALPEAERQGAPLGIDFDSIERIREQAGRIWARSADHNVTMPPVGGPEEEERVLLGDWLACGAPLIHEMNED